MRSNKDFTLTFLESSMVSDTQRTSLPLSLNFSSSTEKSEISPFFSKAKQTFLHIANGTLFTTQKATRAISQIAKNPVVQLFLSPPLIALKATNIALEIIHKSCEVAERGESVYTFFEAAHDLSDAILEEAEEEKSIPQRVLEYVPIVRDISNIEETCEKVTSSFGKYYIYATLEFLKHSAPYILQGVCVVSDAVLAQTKPLEKNLYFLTTDPKHVRYYLIDLADKIEGIRYKIIVKKAFQMPTFSSSSKSAVFTFSKTGALLSSAADFAIKPPQSIKQPVLFEYIASPSFKTIARISAYFCSYCCYGLGRLSYPFLISKSMTLSASFLQYVFYLPYSKQIVASLLEQKGIPVYKIEETLITIPTKIMRIGVKGQEVVINGINQLFEDAQNSHIVISNARENLHNAQHLWQLQSEQKELIQKIQKEWQEFAHQLKSASFCALKRNDLLCSFKSHLELMRYAKDLHLDLYDMKFLEAVRRLAEPPVNFLSFLGLSHEVPDEIRKSLDELNQHIIKFSENAKEITSLTPSEKALQELQGIWGTLIKLYARSDLSGAVDGTYLHLIKPEIDEALHLINHFQALTQETNALLDIQIEKNLELELSMQKFLEDKAKVAHETMQKKTENSWQRLFLHTASYGLPLLGWLLISSKNLVVLPFIAQRIIPHLLREYAPSFAKEARPFWYNTGEKISKLPNQALKVSSDTTKWIARPYSLAEFELLEESQKETLLFILSHSEAFLSLQKTRFGNHVFSLDFYERQRFCHETYIRSLKSPSNELEELLSVSSEVSQDESMTLAPGQFRQMSRSKISHALQILETYHPKLLEALQSTDDSLFSQLASIFKFIPSHQRNYLLYLTNEEFQTFSELEMKHFIAFLFIRNHQEKKFLNELSNLSMGLSVDVHSIVCSFNKLGATLQAECRRMHDLQEKLTPLIKKELFPLKRKIRAIACRLKTLTDIDYLGHKEMIKALKKKLNDPNTTTSYTLQKLLQEHKEKLELTSNKIAKLLEYQRTCKAKFQALNNLLGKESTIKAPERAKLIDTPISTSEISPERALLEQKLQMQEDTRKKLEAEIASLKEELNNSQSSSSIITKKLIRFKTLKYYNLPMITALCQKFRQHLGQQP